MARLSRRDFLPLGAALALGACRPQGRLAEEPRDRFDWTLHEPQAVGMTRAGLDQVRAAIRKNIDNKVIPGAVTVIVRHNKLVWYEAQGVRDVSSGRPMARDDIFRMMSSTKPVTAVAVLMMMDEGKLALDDRVSRFIPEFKGQKVAVARAGAWDASGVTLVPADREITLEDLLTHTSGLASHGDLWAPPPGSLVNRIERRPDDTLADYVPRLGSAALDFQPGTKWRYSPLDGFDVLLRVVEITSGRSAEEFLGERLFEPLGMRDTYFNVPRDKKGRVVGLYGSRQGTFQVEKPLFEEGPWKYHSGSCGLFSTAHDFVQFEAMLLNRGTLNGRRILKAETVDLMARNHVGKLFAESTPVITAGHGFGLGVSVVEDRTRGDGQGVGAFGWVGIYGTHSWADPELDVAAALLIQMQPAPAIVKSDFQQAIRKAIVR